MVAPERAILSPEGDTLARNIRERTNVHLRSRRTRTINQRKEETTMTRSSMSLAVAVALAMSGCADMMRAPGATATAASGSAGMTFFVTSESSGKGADFGGLAGADRHCQQLATAVGAGSHTWHAYLSTQGPNAVNARDRIGRGPWRNVKGVVIAKDVADLHGENNIDKQTGLTEKGTMVKTRPDTPNQHDILTGSKPDGTAFSGAEDRTCGNYTKSGSDGNVMLGHLDRTGTNPDPVANRSWNSSHPSRGCSVEGLASTGSAGYLYCFAVN
jgi:hypothetical protein